MTGPASQPEHSGPGINARSIAQWARQERERQLTAGSTLQPVCPEPGTGTRSITQGTRQERECELTMLQPERSNARLIEQRARRERKRQLTTGLALQLEGSGQNARAHPAEQPTTGLTAQSETPVPGTSACSRAQRARRERERQQWLSSAGGNIPLISPPSNRTTGPSKHAYISIT